MRMTRVTGKPLQPWNGLRARAIAHVYGGPGYGFPDVGICQIEARGSLRLMTWGLNATRETVEKFSGLRWVWVGIGTHNGVPRDNFERLL